VFAGCKLGAGSVKKVACCKLYICMMVQVLLERAMRVIKH
jgi:hypothetical protein